MKDHIIKLSGLTQTKSHKEIKLYLENIPKNEKGPAFEWYLAYLFEGNGFLTRIMGGRGDIGADILLYNPNTPQQVDLIVQAKNWSSTLPVKEVTHELGMFEKRGKKKYNCTFYTLIAINGFVKDAQKLSEFNMALHDWTYVESLIANYNKSNKETAVIDLRSHNQVSFDKTIEGFEINNRICVIQATGTGKSYVTARLIQEHIDRKTLLVAPSNLILKQFKENFHYILANTNLITYAKLANVMKNKSKEYGLIILDEFHRCGAEVWGTGVETLLNQNPKALVFGTSATPIRTLDQGRDMSDEIFDSYVANQISLPDAIVRSILPEPKYVSALYNIDEDVEDTIALIMGSKKRAKEQKELVEEIKNAKIDWEKTSGIPEIFKKHIPIDDKPKKFIVFCQDKNHLADMELDVQKWILKAFGRDWNRHAFTITSDIVKSKNEKTIEEFKSANSSKTIYLMFSIDMFNEGLHLPDVDGVILLRPTQSDRIFLQQIGRCLQVGSSSSQPLIFDLVNNFMSLRSFNFMDSLENSSKEYNKRREQLGLDPKTVDVVIIDEAKDIVSLFDAIKEKALPWQTQYSYLVEFIKSNNRFPYQQEQYPKNNNLGHWCNTQRQFYKKHKLSEDKIKMLDELDIIWDSISETWQANYNHLLAFLNLNNRFPKQGEEYPKSNSIGDWCDWQRYKKKNNTLSSDNIEQLNEIKFVWNLTEQRWEDQYKILEEYVNIHKCFPKYDVEYPKGNKLGNWCNQNRSSHRNNTLPKEKIERLEALGIIWNPRDEDWDKQYQLLIGFHKEHNRFPKEIEEYPKGNTLGIWCSQQRAYYRKEWLKQDRKEKLDKIGFLWEIPIDYILEHREVEQDWETTFEYVKKYKLENGNFPAKNANILGGSNNLGVWLVTQRSNYNDSEVDYPIERYNKLVEIGFDFAKQVKVGDWDTSYNHCKRFQELEGRLPYQKDKYPGDYPIGSWLSTQRVYAKKGKLSNSQLIKLQRLGFHSDPREEKFLLQVKNLKEFIKLKGCYPKKDEEFPEGNRLGAWVSMKKIEYKNGVTSLTSERIAMLKREVDFPFPDKVITNA